MNKPITSRAIQAILPARPSRDGDGVAIQRIAGMGDAWMDPILMIDELRSEHREDFAGGFPPHPHRGMQTLTYLRHGGIIHEDNQGNRGEIRSGGAQWMSAARGVIHSEMPTLDSAGLHGFQVWINLPAAEKMAAPRYRDVPGPDLTRVQGQGFNATMIAGSWSLEEETGNRVVAEGPLTELASYAGLLDLNLQPEGTTRIELQAANNAVAYIYDGTLVTSEGIVSAQHLLTTRRDGTSWQLQAGADGAGVLIMQGRPLKEPVTHYGPFVMNTAQEIEQALQDYQTGRFSE